MNSTPPALDRPPWWVCLLLPLLHFASVKLTFLCAVTPENEVVVWLPNAVLLAALLRYQGQRGVLLAALSFSSDVVANLSAFSWLQAVLLSGVNLVEIGTAYLLMRRAGMSFRLQRVQDFGTFAIAGPVLGALVAGLLAAVVLKTTQTTATPYLTLARLWWFGDGLGLLIYTPLLLALAQPAAPRIRWQRLDATALLLSAGLAAVVFATKTGEIGSIPVTPTLLLPSVVFIGARFGVRWTTLAVALISLLTAWVLTLGHQPFGNVNVHLEVARAQEFILTLCSVGIGFSILMAQLKAHERELESKVSDRTQALEASNRQLIALSTTDSLTGIANRRHFDEVLASEWNRSLRSGQPLALVMLDVDMFKKYNDHYGHQLGDDCLRQVAQVLPAQFRRTGDFVARYGGEEFVLLTSVLTPGDALQIADSVRQTVQDLAVPHTRSPFGVVTASLGVAWCKPTPGDSLDQLLQRADEGLYQAKAQGRNQTVLRS